MARDVVSRREDRDLHEYLNGVNVFSKLYNEVVTSTARADIVKTIPTSTGTFYKPTNYYGRFFYSSGEPFDYWYRTGTNQPERHVFGQISSVGLLSGSLNLTWGCGGDGLPKLGVLQSRTASSIQSQVNNQQWSLAQDLAEMRETLAFALSPITLLARFIRSIRSNPFNLWNLARTIVITTSGKRKNGLLRYMRNNKFTLMRHSLRGASSAWLAYKFAWLPLMSSLHNAAQAMRNGLNTRPLCSVQASASRPVLKPPVKPGTTVVRWQWYGTEETHTVVHAICGSSFLSMLNSLGLTDPMKIAWELLPLSFVVDWFLPIGNFIDALMKPMGITFHYGFTTTAVKWFSSASYYPSTTAYGIRGQALISTVRLFSFKREKLTTWTIPTPYFRGFGAFANGGKLTSLLALAVQRVN